MTYFAHWHGGSSYRPSNDADDEREEFDSIEDLKDELRRRYNGTAIIRQNGQRTWTETPAVDRTSNFYVYVNHDPEPDDYPAFLIEFGPRGGVVKSHT